ncbi:hypothetical protein ACLKA7_006918 [Drosophila subpalustris]
MLLRISDWILLLIMNSLRALIWYQMRFNDSNEFSGNLSELMMDLNLDWQQIELGNFTQTFFVNCTDID